MIEQVGATVVVNTGKEHAQRKPQNHTKQQNAAHSERSRGWRALSGGRLLEQSTVVAGAVRFRGVPGGQLEDEREKESDDDDRGEKSREVTWGCGRRARKAKKPGPLALVGRDPGNWGGRLSHQMHAGSARAKKKRRNFAALHGREGGASRADGKFATVCS